MSCSPAPVSGSRAGLIRIRFEHHWRVRWVRLPAICFESFVEGDIALRKAAVKRKSEKHPLWNALEDKSGNILKAKSPVVLRVPDQTAAFGVQVFQT